MNNFHEKKRTCFALSTLPSLEEGHASYYQSPSVHPGGTALWGEVHRCLTLCYDSACSLAETSHLFHSQTEPTKQTTLRNMLDSDGSVHLETNGQTFTYLEKKRACLVQSQLLFRRCFESTLHLLLSCPSLPHFFLFHCYLAI
jgi:hypothetical protein